MQRDIAKVLLTERELSDRIRELGKEITRDYNGKPLHLVGILKGSVVFMTDLMRTIDLPLTMDFMAPASRPQEWCKSSRICPPPSRAKTCSW